MKCRKPAKRHRCGYCGTLRPVSEMEGPDGIVSWRCVDADACVAAQRAEARRS